MKILIVDDNNTNLVVLKALSGKLDGNEVYTFNLPAEALAWCAGHDPDLVLLDYMMPDIDGFQFLARFRALPGKEEIPVIMITADNELEVRYRALELGANDFLTKPVDKTEFLARMRNMLALRQSRKLLADRADWLAQEVRKATADIVERERGAIFLLSKVAEYRDPETGAHILRMAHYCKLIGQRLGLADDAVAMLFDAAPMHDIGKVGIPDHILLKPGRLDAGEMAVMRQHARIGWEILTSAPFENALFSAAAEIALSHHEKVDGSGYPQGLAGEAIPLMGRIVAVADVFDALTSARPYKVAWELDAARDFLSAQAGSHFDARCVEAFLAAWDEVLEIRARYEDDSFEA
ncbi:response regulator [Parasulfuritortus cantonensis]|uniref:Response regulator n=1 Tax=Parasulfuritortus cantonensis TaxID=2528202 RepID=A0A4R1BCC5_9PROT|nr:HD domain-containing phosphohydrolase [Parasulfuritortus cantonensis]TCJ14654.1 response regulator [Parasulfuritortus cantonensis]